MAKLRVLHLIGDLGIGGAQAMLTKILSHRDASRFDCGVIALANRGAGFQEKISALGIPVVEIGMGSAPGPGSLKRLVGAIRDFAPDVIKAWMYHSNMLSILVQPFLRRRVPVIFGIRQSLYDISTEKFPTRIVIRAGAKLSDSAARIVYNAHISSEQHEGIGYARSRRVIIHNGFDCNEFKPDAEARDAVRRELNLPPSAVLIGLLARYHPMKDHATFLRAAGILHRAHPDICFVLAGSGVDSGNQQLAALIDECGVQGAVRLLGVRRDVARLNAALDVASLTGKFEGFPNVMGEAMACGVPCAAVDSGETGVVIADTGRLVPPRDPERLAEVWRELVQSGPEFRRELGQRARQRVLDHFELSVITRRFEQMFEEVAGGAVS